MLLGLGHRGVDRRSYLRRRRLLDVFLLGKAAVTEHLLRGLLVAILVLLHPRRHLALVAARDHLAGGVRGERHVVGRTKAPLPLFITRASGSVVEARAFSLSSLIIGSFCGMPSGIITCTRHRIRRSTRHDGCQDSVTALQ